MANFMSCHASVFLSVHVNSGTNFPHCFAVGDLVIKMATVFAFPMTLTTDYTIIYTKKEVYFLFLVETEVIF